jgi:hypothetical protein
MGNMMVERHFNCLSPTCQSLFPAEAIRGVDGDPHCAMINHQEQQPQLGKHENDGQHFDGDFSAIGELG